MRTAVLELLYASHNHPTTDEIHACLNRDGMKMGVATLYQNLNTLVEGGLLARFNGVDGVMHYEANLTPHHHAVCKGCGRVIDVHISEAEQQALNPLLSTGRDDAEGWQISSIHLEFAGLCPSCSISH
ncbi:transcriptional repressor [Myxococcota bacterium]|nr:transcriptional repressor [Myxococcota bacterium]